MKNDKILTITRMILVIVVLLSISGLGIFYVITDLKNTIVAICIFGILSYYAFILDARNSKKPKVS